MYVEDLNLEDSYFALKLVIYPLALAVLVYHISLPLVKYFSLHDEYARELGNNWKNNHGDEQQNTKISEELVLAFIALAKFLQQIRYACAGSAGILGFSLFFKRPKAPHPHQRIATKFLNNHPNYSLPDNQNVEAIFCPILFAESKEPVCISFDYNGHTYSHVYDYNELKNWFKGSAIYPTTNINLLGENVTNFKISFDISPTLVNADSIKRGNRE